MTSARTDLTLGEAIALAVICFGWSILLSVQSVANGFHGIEFSDQALVGIVISEIFFALIALSVLRFRGYAIEMLYPVPSLSGALFGAALFAAATAAGWLLTLLFTSGQATQPVEAAMADATVSLPVVIVLAVVNGAFEEIFLLGVLQRGLRRYGPSMAIGTVLLIRLVCHLYQGPLGAVSILGYGLVLGLYYWRSDRLFLVVFAHILADILPFVFWPARA